MGSLASNKNNLVNSSSSRMLLAVLFYLFLYMFLFPLKFIFILVRKTDLSYASQALGKISNSRRVWNGSVRFWSTWAYAMHSLGTASGSNFCGSIPNLFFVVIASRATLPSSFQSNGRSDHRITKWSIQWGSGVPAHILCSSANGIYLASSRWTS